VTTLESPSRARAYSPDDTIGYVVPAARRKPVRPTGLINSFVRSAGGHRVRAQGKFVGLLLRKDIRLLSHVPGRLVQRDVDGGLGRGEWWWWWCPYRGGFRR